MPTPITSNRGFTLIEAVMVLVITAIVAAMVAVFIQKPVQSYVDSARRADLTDIADTAVRRMAREIRLALPNSVRNPADGSDQCIEFMPTKIVPVIGGARRCRGQHPGLHDRRPQFRIR